MHVISTAMPIGSQEQDSVEASAVQELPHAGPGTEQDKNPRSLEKCVVGSDECIHALAIAGVQRGQVQAHVTASRVQMVDQNRHQHVGRRRAERSGGSQHRAGRVVVAQGHVQVGVGRTRRSRSVAHG